METPHEVQKQAEKDRTKARVGSSDLRKTRAEGPGRRWKLQPRVRSGRRHRDSRNQLPQRNSHEVSSCPFNQPIELAGSPPQPSLLRDPTLCNVGALKNAVKHPTENFFQAAKPAVFPHAQARGAAVARSVAIDERDAHPSASTPQRTTGTATGGGATRTSFMIRPDTFQSCTYRFPASSQHEPCVPQKTPSFHRSWGTL